MSNSSLVSYTRISPNHSNGRNGEKISRITPHYMAGLLSVETCASIFANPSRQASSNYGIGPDGRVGLYVDEADRSWCSSSGYNDRKAVTIECANRADGSLTDATWRSLIALCADICKRNGISRLNYTGDDSGNLTMHKWYGSTDCPGPWLSHEFGRLAAEVNAVLNGGGSPSDGNAKNNTNGGRLDEDGIGGYNTVLDLQDAVSAPFRDGFLSGQRRANWTFFNGITSVEFDGGSGSSTVRKLQEKIGASVDGVWGKETSRKLQQFLQLRGYDIGPCGVDGYAGADTIKALQKCLNDGRFK